MVTKSRIRSEKGTFSRSSINPVGLDFIVVHLVPEKFHYRHQKWLYRFVDLSTALEPTSKCQGIVEGFKVLELGA
jgi:hypothetical protein